MNYISYKLQYSINCSTHHYQSGFLMKYMILSQFIYDIHLVDYRNKIHYNIYNSQQKISRSIEVLWVFCPPPMDFMVRELVVVHVYKNILWHINNVAENNFDDKPLCIESEEKTTYHSNEKYIIKFNRLLSTQPRQSRNDLNFGGV